MILYQVDTFTDKIFSGNQAGVCVLEDALGDDWMQSIANEMNLSETAFLVKKEKGYNLRWFTPLKEVDLCGHGTLASAHVLWESGIEKEFDQIDFYTKSGLLSAVRKENFIVLDFPAEVDSEVLPPEALVKALNVVPKYIGRNRLDYIVEVENDEMVRHLEPDFTMLKTIHTRGVIVTSMDTSGEYDFISRFFAPALGVLEDPVTGSSHCCLGPYWQRRTGKSSFKAYQASKRGGILKIDVAADRVYIGGNAVTVFKGSLHLGDKKKYENKEYLL